MTRRRDYELVRTQGRSQGGRLLAVSILEQPSLAGPKAGIIVPKALGCAAIRNRIKRRLREVVRHSLSELAPDQFVVTIARRGSVKADFRALASEWMALARRVRAFANRPEASRP
jgi:ribonuclease P protein component